MDANYQRELYLSPFDTSYNDPRRVAEGNYVQTSYGSQTRYPNAFALIPDFTPDSQGVVSAASTGRKDEDKQVDLSDFCSLFTSDDNLSKSGSHMSPAPTFRPFSIDRSLPFLGHTSAPVERLYWRGLNVALPLPPSPAPAETPLLSTLAGPRSEVPSSSATGLHAIRPTLDFDDDDLAFLQDGDSVSSEPALDDAPLPSLSYSPTTSSGTRSLGPETPIAPYPTLPPEHRPCSEVKQEGMGPTLKKTSRAAFCDLTPRHGPTSYLPSGESIPARTPQLQLPDSAPQDERYAADAHRSSPSPQEPASPEEALILEPTQAVKPAGQKDAKPKRTSIRSKQPPSPPILVPLDVSLLTEVITTVRTSDKGSREFRMERRREKVVPPGIPGNKLSWYKVGEHSVCPFPAIGDPTRTCGEYYIDDRKLAAAHVAVHFWDLGFKALEGHPNVPCYWPGCREAPQANNFQRHVLDTHLHISWHLCECGGSYSRGQQQSNVRRHEGTEMHQAFLRRKAQGLEETNGNGIDVCWEGASSEFAQGSSQDGAMPSVDNEAVRRASSGTGSRCTGGKKRKQDTQGEGDEIEGGQSTRKKPKCPLKRKEPLP